MGKKQNTAPKTTLSPEQAEAVLTKLEPFRALIETGEVPAAKIAEMAGLTSEEAAELEKAMAHVAALDETPLGDGADADPTAYEQAKAQGSIAEIPGAREALLAAHQAHEAKVAETRRASSAGPVRCLQKAVIKGPDGRTWRISRRDVYSGAQADFLRTHHPKLIESYPPAAE